MEPTPIYNKEQQQLIDAPIDKIVVGASAAGSGKTHTMIGRAKRILEEFPTGNLLLISFTRNAASDLKQRLKNDLPFEYSRRAITGTFHSILGNILRENAVDVGLSPNFTIIDERSTITMIKKLYEIEPKAYEEAIKNWFKKDWESEPYEITKKQITQFANAVSILVNNSYPEELETGEFSEETKNRVIKRAGMNNARYFHVLYDLFKLTLKECRQQNVVTYDQILFLAYLFCKHGNVNKIKQQYVHVMIDEFQDSNLLQVEIAKMITEDNLTVIGDIDQSIYSFRGGRPQLMDEISQKAHVVHLPTNYRSYQPILDQGNQLIKRNQLGRHVRKPMVAAKELDNQYAGVKWLSFQSDTDEANTIIQYIQLMHNRLGIPYNEMAILARSRMALPIINSVLSRTDIPVNDTTNFADFMKSEVMVDMLNFMKILTNPKDVYAFYHTLDRPRRGIGEKTLEKLESHAKEVGMTIVEYIFSDHIDQLTPKLKEKLHAYRHTYQHLLSLEGKQSMVDVVEFILEDTGYLAWVNRLKQSERQLRHIDILMDMVREFEEEYRMTHTDYTVIDSLSQFVFECSDMSRSETPDGVTISTIHGAKGLEWGYVFLVGCEDGVFPMMKDDLEDERRLFYVAITRAKNGLVVTSSKRRVTVNQPSLKPSTLLLECSFPKESITNK